MLEVIGEGHIHFFDGIDECPHTPGKEELWQESWVLEVWDPDSDVYVFLRMGVNPNLQGGLSSAWLMAWTPEHMYKHTDDSLPYSATQRTDNSILNGLPDGKGFCKYEYNGQHVWTVSDPRHGVNINLTVTDDYPGVGYFKASSGALVKEMAGNHIETTSKVTGSVEVAGKHHDIAGIAWRDHSWGVRNWAGVRAHRGFLALFGDDLHVFMVTFLGKDGKLSKNGVIIRHNKTIEFTEDFEITAYIGEDGASNSGGQVSITIDGERKIIDFIPQGKSSINWNHGFACVDNMCKVKMGDLVGVGLAETSSNPQGGMEVPRAFDSSPGVVENGLYPR
jgi:hypothetical protein